MHVNAYNDLCYFVNESWSFRARLREHFCVGPKTQVLSKAGTKYDQDSYKTHSSIKENL